MSKDLYSFKLPIDSNDIALQIYGTNDKNIKLIELQLEVSITVRYNEVHIEGELEKAKIVERILQELITMNEKDESITERDILYLINTVNERLLISLSEVKEYSLTKNVKSQMISPKTVGQYHYIKAIESNDLVFGIGPAGTGKTFLAVVMAVRALKNGDVKKIILTRPAVEAGESLGFLPGDLKEKVDPYLRPLYDGLYEMLGEETVEKLIERNTIEIAPLAYMRGRTLDDAYIILDEAQNTTDLQMKMFLTRLGFSSKMIVTGDASQVDLPRGKRSGLIHSRQLLNNIKGIKFVELNELDVVRHPLVSKIIKAYDKEESAF
jgi:phosphate starvation-inducible PhoH-like protein